MVYEFKLLGFSVNPIQTVQYCFHVCNTQKFLPNCMNKIIEAMNQRYQLEETSRFYKSIVYRSVKNEDKMSYTCTKIYLGRTRMAKDFKLNPDHGSPEQLPPLTSLIPN
ncbi:hypothetical protein M0802_012280 [Mischocyttarus mexicanus]|nr:hypothetical protein M0802_012280 [Mischocyttarus mexicanus]